LSFLFSWSSLKRPKLGSTLSKSSLSEASSLPSSISLRDEGPGVHKPNEGLLVLGELLLEPVSPAAVVRDGPRPRGRWEAEVRRIDDPKAALAELLRLPMGTMGSEYTKEPISGPRTSVLLMLGFRPRMAGKPSAEVDRAEIGVEVVERKCSVLADMRMSYIWWGDTCGSAFVASLADAARIVL
jgi:hypothetical protein